MSPVTAGLVLAYLPSPPQGVWQLGPIPLRAYALCIIVGIIVAAWWSDRRWRARGGQPGDVLDVALIAVPFGLIGGRIYHVITDWWRYFGDDGKGLKAAFEVWDGGLGIWGAVAFGALGGWIGCRWKRIKLPSFGDAIAPAILLAQAIGRLGNYFNQELYGDSTTVPWGLELYERVDPDTGRRGIGVIDGVSNGTVLEVAHPTFLYELLWNLIIVALLVFLDRRFRIGHGRLFALYVAGYCVGRFAIELMRSDEATHILGLRVNVLVAALVFLGAALYVVMAPKGRETGLSMYWPDRAKVLAAEGAVGYVPPTLDDDGEFDDVGDGEFDNGEFDDRLDSGADGDHDGYQDELDQDEIGDEPSEDDSDEPDHVVDDVTDDAVTDDDVTDDAVTDDVATDDAVTDDEAGTAAPVGAEAVEAGAVEAGGAAGPVVDAPAVAESGDAVAEEPAATAESADETVDDTPGDGSAAHEPGADEPGADESGVEPTDEAGIDDPVTDESVAAHESEAQEPSADEPADESGADESGADESGDGAGTDEPVTDDPAADEPVADTPITAGPGYTVVSDLDGLDGLDEITVVESGPAHEIGAMEIRRAEPEDD